MLPTWVFGWPSGKETGSYLAVDLGGTNLRVCEVELEGDGKFSITQSKYKLTDEQKVGDGQALCELLANIHATKAGSIYGPAAEMPILLIQSTSAPSAWPVSSRITTPTTMVASY